MTTSPVITTIYKSNKKSVFIILLLVVAAAYFNSLTGVLVPDGALNLQGWSLPDLSLKINLHFAGQNPLSYHIINILLHFLNSFLVFLLTFKIFTLNIFKGEYKETAQKIAFICALLFAAHPLSVYTATYITMRAALIGSLFYFMSLLTFLNYRAARYEEEETRNLTASIIFGILALASRPAAAAIPLTFLAVEVIFFNDKRLQIKKVAVFYIAIFIFAALLVTFLSPRLYGVYYSGSINNSTLFELILTQFRALWHYLMLVLLPLPDRIGIEYDIIKSTSLISPVTTILSIAALFALIAAAYIRRKKRPLASFIVLFFVINSAVELFLLPLEPLSLHKIYLSSFALFFAAAYLAVRLYERAKAALKGSAIFRPLLIILFSAIIALLTMVTVRENSAFSSRTSLWEDAYKTSPEKEVVLNNLAAAYLESGLYEKALELYLKAIDKNSDNVMTNFKLADTYFHLKRYSLAESFYNKAIGLKKGFVDAYIKLGELYEKVNRFDYAIIEYEKAAALKPESYIAYNRLAKVYYTLGDLKKALEYYLKASEMLPDDPYLHYEVAKLYELLGDYKNALKEYEAVLDIELHFEFKKDIEPKIKILIRKY